MSYSQIPTLSPPPSSVLDHSAVSMNTDKSPTPLFLPNPSQNRWAPMPTVGESAWRPQKKTYTQARLKCLKTGCGRHAALGALAFFALLASPAAPAALALLGPAPAAPIRI